MASRDVTIKISAQDSFSTVLAKYNQEMDKAEKNTREVGRSTNDMANTVKGLFTLALAQQVGNYVGELVTLGNEANATESRFRELTSTMGGYEETMAGLRAATLGAANDMEIQSGAMLLIQTAGVKTNDELQKMMNLITMTKKPSEDMTTAINNFGLMLANNSILRLDSFGISASKVRARIIELQATLGVDRSEAFRMAVLEEGAKNIERFGDAADAASNSLSRLGVLATNAFQDLAQQTASGAQGWGLAIEYLLGVTPQQQAHQKRLAEEAAESLALDYQEALDAAMSMGGMNEGAAGRFIKEALSLSINDPSLLTDLETFKTKIFDTMAYPQRYRSADVWDDILQSTLQIQAANVSEREVAAEIAAEQERQAAALAQSAANQRVVLSFTDQLALLNNQNTRAIVAYNAEVERTASLRAQMLGQIGEAGMSVVDVAFRYNDQAYGDTGIPQFMAQGQADEMRAAADSVALYVEQAKAADELNNDLFSDEQIEQLESYSKNLSLMADGAQKAADAFAGMSLSEIFGEGSGGRLGELSDIVADAMTELGKGSDVIANFRSEMDLLTGRDTMSSRVIENMIAPTIASTAGIDAVQAQLMTTNLNDILNQALLQGININNPAFLDPLVQAFNAADFQVVNPQQFIDSLPPIAEMAGSFVGMAEDGSVIENTMRFWGEQAPVISENMDLVEGSLGAAATHTDKIKAALDDMSGKEYTLKIKPEFVDVPTLFAQLLPSLFQLVASAGGMMPGTDQRASQSGNLIRQGGISRSTG